MENSLNRSHPTSLQEKNHYDTESPNFNERLDYLENWIKNERKFRQLGKNVGQNEFENTCPLRLNAEQLDNPITVLENFFSNTDLTIAKSKLRYWFKIALTEDLQHENGNELLFFHNQLIQLFHAGYVLVKDKCLVNENTDQNHLRNIDILISSLNKAEKRNPMGYLNEILTIASLTDIRFGMQEWLYSALSNRSSISQLDGKFIFEQFELLEKLLEALFLISIRIL